jgi:hypothetical protein
MAGNSATLNWTKYPYPKDFGKYVITVNSQTPIEVTDINKTSYILSNLVANTAYQVSITAKPKTGTFKLAYPMSVSFGTQSRPPVINSLTVTPETAATGQQVQVTAQVTDLDTNIKKVELTLISEKDKKNLSTQNYDSNNVTFTHTFQTTAAGEYTLYLTASDESSTAHAEKKITIIALEKPNIAFSTAPVNCQMKQDCTGVIKVTNKAKIDSAIVCDVNWGDGNKETAEIGPTTAGKKKSMPVAKEEEKTGDSFSIKHQYQQQGSFTITATATTQKDKVSLTSEPISKSVNVTAAAAEISLTRDTIKGTANNQTFHIKAAAGSYPVASWTLTFGDGQSTSGQGVVDKDVSHVYAQKSEGYGVEFTVKDSQNTEVKKIVALKIARDATASDLGGGAQSQLQNVQPGGTKPPAGGQLQKADGAGQTVRKSSTQVKTTTTQTDANKPQDTAKTQEVTKAKEQAKAQEAAKPQEETKAEESVEKETVIAEKSKVQNIDLALADLKMPDSAAVGKAISINVSIKDNNDIAVEKVGVSLYVGVKKIETQEINLKPKETKKLTFSYIPEKAGTVTIKVKIEKVKGFRDVNVKNDTLTEKVEVK